MKKKYFVFALLILLFTSFTVVYGSKKPIDSKMKVDNNIAKNNVMLTIDKITKIGKYEIDNVKKADKCHFDEAAKLAEIHNNFIKKISDFNKVINDSDWELESAQLPKNPCAAKDVVQTEESLRTGKRLSTTSAVTINQHFQKIKSDFNAYTLKVKEYFEAKYKKYFQNENYSLVEDWKKTAKETKAKGKWHESLLVIIEANQKKMEKADISSNEILFADNFTKINKILKNLKLQMVKATYRAGWDEFGIAWIMLLFGVVTLYGGLFITITNDFTKNKSCPENGNNVKAKEN